MLAAAANPEPQAGDRWATRGMPGLEAEEFVVVEVRGKRVRFKDGTVGNIAVMMTRTDVWLLKRRR